VPGRVAAVTPEVGAPTPRRTVGTAAASPGSRGWRAQFALLFWLALGVAVVAALIMWPYPARCGIGLGYYLAVVGALAAAGALTAASAWKHRAPFIHLLGLAMVAAAGVVGARDVLPRVGYAIPSAEHPASWACAVDPAAAPSGGTSVPGGPAPAPR
jgi:hypothetical protein